MPEESPVAEPADGVAVEPESYESAEAWESTPAEEPASFNPAGVDETLLDAVAATSAGAPAAKACAPRAARKTATAGGGSKFKWLAAQIGGACLVAGVAAFFIFRGKSSTQNDSRPVAVASGEDRTPTAPEQKPKEEPGPAEDTSDPVFHGQGDFRMPKSKDEWDWLATLKAAPPTQRINPVLFKSGSGFVISSGGLILTNRHVVADCTQIAVMLSGQPDKAERTELVTADDDQDLALIRLQTGGEKLAPITLAPADVPNEGADCTVMGYPLLDRLGASVKITRGIVSSTSQSLDGADVLVDAKVNPGNSGGPMLDKHANVMAIICMKTTSNENEDTYGMGISAGKIRKFLAKNHVSVSAGSTSSAELNSEQIAKKAKPVTVLIIGTNQPAEAAKQD